MACRVKQVKFQGPDAKISYGSCAKIWLSMHVNNDVNGLVKTPEGVEVEISESARNQLRNKWNQMGGRPFKAIISRDPMCTEAICFPCIACGLISCKSKGCINCGFPDPVDMQWATVRELWFGNRSEDSACEGCSTHLCSYITCGAPIWCSKNCVDKIDLYPYDVDVTVIGPSSSYVIDIQFEMSTVKINLPLNQMAPTRQLMTVRKDGTSPGSNIQLVNQSGSSSSPLPPQYASPPLPPQYQNTQNQN
jgi:hypothetical protein